MEKVYAIATSFNPDVPRLEEVIRATRGQVSGIILTDNNSRPEIKDSLRALEKKSDGFATIIWKPNDGGLGASLNAAAHMAMERGATWVLTLDDDSIIGDDMVAALFNAYHSLPEQDRKSIGLMMPNEKTPRGFAYPPDGLPKIHDDGGTTAGQMVKTAILPGVGFWNEGLFIDSVDGEFCFRVRQHGWKTLLVPRVAIYTRPGDPVMRKFFGKTVMVTNYAPYRYYFMTRNLTYLYIRNFRTYILRNKYWYRAFWAVIIPRFLIKVILFEKNRGRKLRAVWRGFKDGLRGQLGGKPENI